MTSTESSAQAGGTLPEGTRPTRQRRAVVAALERLDEFRSAQEIHEALAGAGERVGLATVYRTLQALAAGEDVDVLRGEDGETRYRRCSGTQFDPAVGLCGQDLRLERFEVLDAARAEREVVALRRELARHLCAEPAARSGDQDVLAHAVSSGVSGR